MARCRSGKRRSGGLAGAVILNYATEGRKKAFIKKAFRHYLSPAVIERILEDPSQLKLGGERKELTILFSDLEGFTTISEKLDPENLTSLLNLVLSDMTEIILDEGGTLDKYEGDAIIAFWNAPIDQPDHAERACRAALKCQQKIRERQEEYSSKAGAPIRMRIGINTGAVVVGNMGSAKRFDYTVLGDAANLASRLEGANKFFGTRIMVSEQTWKKTSGRFAGRRLGLVRVAGEAGPWRYSSLPGQKPTLTHTTRDSTWQLPAVWKKNGGKPSISSKASLKIRPQESMQTSAATLSRTMPGIGMEFGTWTLNSIHTKAPNTRRGIFDSKAYLWPFFAGMVLSLPRGPMPLLKVKPLKYWTEQQAVFRRPVSRNESEGIEPISNPLSHIIPRRASILSAF